MPYVSDRWLGGTLTNFRTIRSRLARLEELETLRPSDELGTYSKKMQSALNREYRKMYRNLNGMRTMNRLPECLVVIDPRKEKNAIREARKLGITTVALIDTDCDPGRGRSADPRQRRQHPLDRVDRRSMLADAVPRRQGASATEAQVAAEGAARARRGRPKPRPAAGRQAVGAGAQA